MESSIDAEVQKHLDSLEKVQGPSIYQPLVDRNCLCDQKQWSRVLREVADVNNDFNNLRTYIAPVSSFIGVFHYLMYPADGALADQPLWGRILIPKRYPTVPPVVHLISKTNRFNVDVYHAKTDPIAITEMRSSMCFDILRSKESGGTWEPEFTLSALMASLLQSIVSIKVPQENGDEIEEYVSIETLEKLRKNVKWDYDYNRIYLPSQRSIKKIEAAPIPTKYFEFDNELTSSKDSGYHIFASENQIKLQVEDAKKENNVFSIGFELSGLKANPYMIFFVALTNDPQDIEGKSPFTICVRNGSTATAAKKKRYEKLQWFYHGIPLNQENLRIIVTVGYDQFCMSYINKDGKVVVHGDCPVSFLTEAEIGIVKHETFYLTANMKNKGGKQITVRTFQPEVGYLHPVYAGAS